MPQEVLQFLNPQPECWYLDATFGSGGHTALLLKAGARVIALDWDLKAITAGQDRFREQIEAGQLLLIHAPFSQLTDTLTRLKKEQKMTEQVSGCLFDFGTSTMQLLSHERGFTFHKDGPLDMRMDTRLGVTAADLLAALPEKQLAQLFKDFGGEEQAGSIAKAIKLQKNAPTTTTELVKIIESVKRRQRSHLHPATKVFQALRIAVNTELDEIATALPQALQSLKPTGVLVTIAFHEGEDRIVKHTLRDWEAAGEGVSITKKPHTPNPEEVQINPRARSAKLRAFQKN